MRKLALLFALLLSAGCATAPAEPIAQPIPAPPPPEPTFESFEAPLAPYGQWIAVGRYGRVWRPIHVAAGWQPYYVGEWVWTADGWFWVTDEPWGWATYHYGRWAWEPGFGWIWIPGYVWGPAWVAWREGDGFIGWAPLYPDHDAWWVEAYPLVPAHWVFVPVRSFVGVRVDRAAVPRPRVPPLVRSTRPAPPRGIAPAPSRGTRAPAPAPAPAPPHGGPPREAVERQIGRAVTPARVVPVQAPAAARGTASGTVPVYRPAPPAREAPARQPAQTAPPPERPAERAPPARPAPAPSTPASRGDEPDAPRPAPAPAPRR